MIGGGLDCESLPPGAKSAVRRRGRRGKARDDHVCRPVLGVPEFVMNLQPEPDSGAAGNGLPTPRHPATCRSVGALPRLPARRSDYRRVYVLDVVLKRGFSRLKCGKFLSETADLLFNSSQFGV